MFTWDAAKAARNLAKHGVSFESAWDFDWETSVVVDSVRLISFRPANRAEARTYEEISSGKN